MTWLARRIPPVTATELGLFRVLFAAGLWFTVRELRLPQVPFPREMHLEVHPLAQFDWVHALASRPDLVGLLETTALVLIAVFAIGIATRLTFGALVLLLTAWTLVRLTQTGTHNWAALLVALWAMLPVRWGDGLSVYAWWRRHRGRPLPGGRRTRYGYALWIPGLVFGSAMAAAGASKLLHGGVGWITNGTVKYVFVIDSPRAATDWGLWVAGHHWAAVALSAGAVFTELTMVLAVFVRRPLARLPFAVLGLGLLLGFWVFQGELWYAWWTLYLAFFVPWPSLFRRLHRLTGQAGATTEGAPAEPAHALLTAPQWAALTAVVGLQVLGTLLRTEIAPVLSDYPMYSTTYASVAEFRERAAEPPAYRFAIRLEDGTEHDAMGVATRLGLLDSLQEAHAELQEDGGSVEARRRLDAAGRALTKELGVPVAAVVVRVDQREFDFDRGRFTWAVRDALAAAYPVAPASSCAR
ncbi:MAG: hypothetical protein AB7O67_04520 [Vicinamibacterales bacterium]